MKVTLSIPDKVARRFRAAVPARQRSSVVTHLIERELSKRGCDLASACIAANKDKALESDIADWQVFDDGVEE